MIYIIIEITIIGICNVFVLSFYDSEIEKSREKKKCLVFWKDPNIPPGII